MPYRLCSPRLILFCCCYRFDHLCSTIPSVCQWACCFPWLGVVLQWVAIGIRRRRLEKYARSAGHSKPIDRRTKSKQTAFFGTADRRGDAKNNLAVLQPSAYRNRHRKTQGGGVTCLVAPTLTSYSGTVVLISLGFCFTIPSLPASHAVATGLRAVS